MRILVQTKTVGEEGRETSEEKINRAEQRKYPRYRYIHEIEICGKAERSIRRQVSRLAKGMSAATPNFFGGGKVWSCIREAQVGAMCRFEFVGLTEEHRKRIREMCRDLPPFRSMAAI